MVAPGALSTAQVAYWDGILARLAQSDEWKKDLEQNHWENTYRNSRDTRKYLSDEYAEAKKALAEIGLAK